MCDSDFEYGIRKTLSDAGFDFAAVHVEHIDEYTTKHRIDHVCGWYEIVTRTSIEPSISTGCHAATQAMASYGRWLNAVETKTPGD